MQKTLDLLTQLRDAGGPCAIATVVETHRSVSERTGSKAVIDQEGKVVAGRVGGGCAQLTGCHAALEGSHDGEPRIADLDLDDEVVGTGMSCAGAMRVYVEPMLPKLWLLSHGRVAECLSQIGALLGFDIVVDDPMAERKRYPEASPLIDDDLDYRKLTPGRNGLRHSRYAAQGRPPADAAGAAVASPVHRPDSQSQTLGAGA